MMVSVLMQRWLGYHRWQRLHTAGYVAYTLVTAHLLISGSEMGSMPARLLAVLSLITLLAAASATAVLNSTSRARTANGTAGSDVVLNVDPSRCVRYGFCAHEAPELFRLQTDGRLNYRAAVPPESVERALHAAQACPARAVRLGRRAAWLDPEQRVVGFDTGETCRYDGLIVATGTHTVAPEGTPVGEQGLHMLHTIDDAWKIRQDLRQARRVAVVGGGLTGTEVSCTVQALAREAVLIHSGQHLLSKVVGDYIGELVTKEHQASGMDLRLGTRVVTMDRTTGRWRLGLDDGTTMHADMVVVAVGERPSVSWLEHTGIDCSDGVLCDAALRVVGTTNVVAAGAIARWPDLRRSETPARVGHWIAALEHGRAAARTLLHGEDARPVTLLPRFWSEQHGLRIRVCGRIDPAADIAISELRPGRRDTARAGVVATYYLDGHAIGVAGVNAPQAFAITPARSRPTLSWRLTRCRPPTWRRCGASTRSRSEPSVRWDPGWIPPHGRSQ